MKPESFSDESGKRKCAICGKLFFYKYRQKTCSEGCSKELRDRYNRKHAKEYYKKHPLSTEGKRKKNKYFAEYRKKRKLKVTYKMVNVI